jgi:hypothetical protein
MGQPAGEVIGEIARNPASPSPTSATSPHKITSELIEAYSECDRKAYFLIHGQVEGIEHNYS